MKKRTIALSLLSGLLLTSLPVHADHKETPHASTRQDVKEKVSRIVWGAKVSPYVRKVMITLEEKKVAYDVKEILPTKLLVATNQDVPVEFSKLSPLGKIPAYEEISDAAKKDSFSISDSAVIMEYLEQTIKENALRPTCPKANAQVSWMIKYADDILAPVTYKIFFEKIVKPGILKQEPDASAVDKMVNEELPVVLDFLEQTLTKDKRSWIADTKNFTLADIAIVTHLTTLQEAKLNLEEIIGKDRPHLLKYVQTVLARDSFKKIPA